MGAGGVWEPREHGGASRVEGSCRDRKPRMLSQGAGGQALLGRPLDGAGGGGGGSAGAGDG